MNKSICCLFLILLCAACNRNTSSGEDVHSNKDPRTIVVDISKSHPILFSELFEEVTYIPLATTDSFLVGDISRFRYMDGQIYLVSEKKLMQFNARTGDAVMNLHKAGNGPGEYLTISDIHIDYGKHTIEIADSRKKRSSGTVRKEIL